MIDLNNFKNYLKLNTDAKHTQVNYFSRVKCFFDVYKKFNQENINAYLCKRLDDVSKSTFNQTTTALRQYGHMVNVELTFPKYKNIPIKEKDYLTEDEMLKELIPYFPSIFQNNGEYYSFVMKFLFYTGVRPDEMCFLRTCDIDFEKNLFIVRDPKDDEDKKVPFPDCLIPSMKRYLQVDKQLAYKITYPSINYLFTKMNKELNYKKKVEARMMRHSYAHFLLDNSIPIEKLQILLGHADIKTTMIYARPKIDEALQSYFDKIKPKGK